MKKWAIVQVVDGVEKIARVYDYKAWAETHIDEYCHDENGNKISCRIKEINDGKPKMYYLVDRDKPYVVKSVHKTLAQAEKERCKYVKDVYRDDGGIGIHNPYTVMGYLLTKEEYERREKSRRAFYGQIIENSKKDKSIKMTGCWS